jgi:hypothetical protein
MLQTIRCRIGLHRWKDMRNPEGGCIPGESGKSWWERARLGIKNTCPQSLQFIDLTIRQMDVRG